MKARLPHALVFVIVAALYLLSALDFLEYRLTDARFRLTPRDATGELVVVAIDPESLREAGVWPWPRSLHAQLIDRLLDAGVVQIAFDIDFSSASSPPEDRALEAALARAGDRVLLPVFAQRSRRSGAEARLVETAPLAMFRRHARLASINVRPDSDGKIRRFRATDRLPSDEVPTMPADLAGAVRQAREEFFIDFGIQVGAIPQIGYADVLKGAFPPGALVGKKVIVGATAVELGDQLAVPILRALPGVLIEALAFESLVQERALARVSPLLVLLVALALAVFLGPKLVVWSIPRGLALVGVVVVASLVLSLVLQSIFPIILETTPWVLVAVLSYGVALVTIIDRQARRLLAQSTALNQRRILMHAIVEKSFGGIVSIGQSGTVEFCNPAAGRIFRCDPSDLVGQEAASLFVGDSEARGRTDIVHRLLARGTEAGTGEPIEVDGRRSDGEIFPMEVSVAETRVPMVHHPLRPSSDERSVVLCVVRDVTQSKADEEKIRALNAQLEQRVVRRTEELGRANKSLRERQSELAHMSRVSTMGEMTSTLAHELNQPLSAIVLFQWVAPTARQPRGFVFDRSASSVGADFRPSESGEQDDRPYQPAGSPLRPETQQRSDKRHRQGHRTARGGSGARLWR